MRWPRELATAKEKSGTFKIGIINRNLVQIMAWGCEGINGGGKKKGTVSLKGKKGQG